MLQLHYRASAKSNAGKLIIYFIPSDEWIKNGYTFQVQLKKQTDADNWTGLRDLTDSGETVNGRKVYFAEFTVGDQDTSKDLPYGGTARVQFQYYGNNSYIGKLEPIKEIIEIRKVISHAVCELITYRGLSDDEVAEFHTILDGMMNASKEELVDIHALLIDGLINHDREKCISYFEKHYGFVEQSIG